MNTVKYIMQWHVVLFVGQSNEMIGTIISDICTLA